MVSKAAGVASKDMKLPFTINEAVKKLEQADSWIDVEGLIYLEK